MTLRPRGRRITLGAFALALVALLAAGAAQAAAKKSSGTPCWKLVVNDWFDNGRIDGTYPIPCYTQAIQHLSQYPDVAGYSSAEDDIHRALLAAIRLDRGTGGPTPPGSGPGPTGPGSSSGTPATGGGGFFKALGDRLGPGNAQSIPLPLIVLAGLALLLLLAAGGTWFARRLQARRVTSAPLTAPAGPKRR